MLPYVCACVRLLSVIRKYPGTRGKTWENLRNQNSPHSKTILVLSRGWGYFPLYSHSTLSTSEGASWWWGVMVGKNVLEEEAVKWKHT